MKELFSNEQVNSGRQVELDLAKFLAIVWMIPMHCLFVSWGFPNDISVYMQRVIAQFLGCPFSAPVFMSAMGVGFVYSRNQDPTYMIRRGVKTMLLGLVVNVGEFILPHYLAGKLLGEWDIFPIAGGLLLFCVDILAFAGMSMICIGLFKKWKLSAKQILVIAVIFSLIGWALRFHDFGSDVPNLIAGYFIGSAGGFTAFPLFTWFIFPAAGLLFGEYYIRCTDKKKLLRFWPLALAVSVAYFVISWYIPDGFLSAIHLYYFMTTIDAAFCLVCVYGSIGMSRVTSDLLSDSVIEFIKKTSADLNAIYIIQWYIIPLTYIFICYFNRDIVFGDLSLVVISIAELAASIALAAVYKNARKSQER